jgi:hypothetical protein
MKKTWWFPSRPCDGGEGGGGSGGGKAGYRGEYLD